MTDTNPRTAQHREARHREMQTTFGPAVVGSVGPATLTAVNAEADDEGTDRIDLEFASQRAEDVAGVSIETWVLDEAPALHADEVSVRLAGTVVQVQLVPATSSIGQS